MDFTLAAVLTIAGATIGAALITGLIEVLKQGGIPSIVGNEPKWAMALSAVLVILAYIAGVQDNTIAISAESIFGLFLAWYGIVRLAMGIHDDFSNKPSSLRGSVSGGNG